MNTMGTATPSGGMCMRLTMRAEGALAKGDLELAESALQAALEHGARAQHEDRARAWRLMGILRERQGRFDEAEESFRAKADAEAELFEPGDPRAIPGLTDLVRVRRTLEKPIDDYILTVTASLAAMVAAELEAGDDAEKTRVAHWYLVYARFFRAAGRVGEADESYLEALLNLRDAGPRAVSEIRRVGSELADFHRERGDEGRRDQTLAAIEALLSELEDRQADEGKTARPLRVLPKPGGGD